MMISGAILGSLLRLEMQSARDPRRLIPAAPWRRNQELVRCFSAVGKLLFGQSLLA